MRVGLVCPYAWEVPGGVQAHVRDLADALIALGHEVSVLAPADEDAVDLPPYLVSGGRAVPVPFNGSVARLAFGPVTNARVRRWVRDGGFDVLHVHEPAVPSLSALALFCAHGPIVATFHMSTPRSRAMAAVHGIAQPFLEKLAARIAVSEPARQTLVEHFGGDPVLIPNGVALARFARAQPMPGWPGDGGAVGFLGRFDEPRKGFDVLVAAMERLVVDRPGVRLLVAGPGDAAAALSAMSPAVAERVTMLGLISEAEKERMLRSVDLYVAPNTGGESFGMILTEAMAAGAAIAASDLDAFRRVLDGGRAGALFPTGDAHALTALLADLLDDRPRRAELSACARSAVEAFDWPSVATRVLEVYATAIEATDGRVLDAEWAEPRPGT